MTTIQDFIIQPGPHQIFDDKKALAYLLEQHIVFLNTRPYIENSYDPKEKWDISPHSTIVVFVNCNDLFAWGVADAEDISSCNHKPDMKTNELYRLLSYVLDDEYGVERFCCEKRNQRPQEPIIEQMKEKGVWNEWWETLPKYAGDNK